MLPPEEMENRRRLAIILSKAEKVGPKHLLAQDPVILPAAVLAPLRAKGILEIQIKHLETEGKEQTQAIEE